MSNSLKPRRLITLLQGRDGVRKHADHDQSSHGNWANGFDPWDWTAPIGEPVPSRPTEASDWSDLKGNGGPLLQHASSMMANPSHRRWMKDHVSRTLAADVVGQLTDEEREAFLNGEEAIGGFDGALEDLFDDAYSQARTNEGGASIGSIYRDGVNEQAHFFEVLDREGIEYDRATEGPAEWYSQVSDTGKIEIGLYTVANEMLSSWQSTALDHELYARNLQDTANKIHPGEHRTFEAFVSSGMPYEHTPFTPFQESVHTKMLKASQARTRTLLDEVYPNTDSVTLYRGYRSTTVIPDGVQPISSNPMSSWTVDRTVANSFASTSKLGMTGHVYSAQVPKDNIVSSTLTGFGALHEYEFIVNMPDDTLVNVTTYVTQAPLTKVNARSSMNVIYADAPPNDDWIKKGNRIRKHGSHDQSSHGNWARGGSDSKPLTDQMEVYERLRNALPNALIQIEDGFRDKVSLEYAQGLVDGIEAMAAKYPNTAKDVVLIRTGAQMNTTTYIAQALLTKVNAGVAGRKQGLGMVINVDKFGDDEFEYVRENHERPVGVGGLPGLVSSTESKTKWASDIVVHEWGHFVHDKAISSESGEPFFNGVLRNEKLWGEALGTQLGSSYPGTRVAKWSLGIDGTHGPSVYGNNNRAEKFAEAFVMRNGWDGKGKLHPELDSIVAEMEEAAG